MSPYFALFVFFVSAFLIMRVGFTRFPYITLVVVAAASGTYVLANMNFIELLTYGG